MSGDAWLTPRALLLFVVVDAVLARRFVSRSVDAAVAWHGLLQPSRAGELAFATRHGCISFGFALLTMYNNNTPYGMVCMCDCRTSSVSITHIETSSTADVWRACRGMTSTPCWWAAPQRMWLGTLYSAGSTIERR